MHRVLFKAHQRDELLSLGVESIAIECIEVEALPIARQFLRRPPPKNEVLGELRDLQRTLTKAHGAIERLLNATAAVPHLKAAQAWLTAGQGRHAMGGLRLNETSKSLSVAIDVVVTGIAQVPPGPLRHRSADPYVVELIHDALQHGSIAATGDPMSHGLRPSASPRSGFRRMIGICYEAIVAKDDADPERALKAYMKKWRALMRHLESQGFSTERPRRT